MKKRFLSLALALALCLGLLPGTAGAVTRAASNDPEFVIKDGILLAYNGAGGSVVIPDGVTNIISNAFINNTSITEVTIPDSVTTIGDLAFLGCSNLKRVVIGQGVTTIPELAFSQCASLTDVTIPNSVTLIGDTAFGKCTSLKSIVIPDSVTYLGERAFSFCSNLEEVTLPETAAYRQSTFVGCDKLPAHLKDGSHQPEQTGDFTISNRTLTKYSGSDSHVTIPDGVTAIADWAFSNCAQLLSVDFNDVTFVDAHAFSGCVNLATITNYPRKKLEENLASNKRIAHAWTASAIQNAVTPQSGKITTVSNQICAGLHSDYEKAEAIYNWVSENITYDYDYFYGKKPETVYFPEDVLDQRLTVCDGFSRLTQALLQAQGIPALQIGGMADTTSGWPEEGVSNHAWNLAYVDSRWIYMDTTWGKQSNWFDPTELYFSLTHRGLYSRVDPTQFAPDDTPDPSAIKVGNFDDVNAGDFYADAVLWAVDKGVTSGTSATTFSPDTTCSTGEILTFLWRANGSPAPAISNPFSDVAAGAYYADAAVWAYEKGLISGSAFGGDIPATRAATVTYLWKLAGGPDAGPAAFSDVAPSAEYAQAVAWAVSQGITGGTGGGNFSPGMTCTRSQIVTFLYRAYQ